MSNPAGWLSVCETGGCLEIQVQGDTVVLRETSTPDVEVVTTLASWQAWQDKARAEERAAIVAGLRARADKIAARAERTDSLPNMSYAAGMHDAAHLTEMGEFPDVAANHD